MDSETSASGDTSRPAVERRDDPLASALVKGLLPYLGLHGLTDEELGQQELLAWAYLRSALSELSRAEKTISDIRDIRWQREFHKGRKKKNAKT